jgi:hypothetical protein
MSSHDASHPVLSANGACSLPVSTCSIIHIYSYFDFAASAEMIIANAEKILSKAEVLQSHNRDGLSKGKRLFGDSKKLLASFSSILEEEVCSDGISAILKIQRVVLPKFENFSKLFLASSGQRSKRIMDFCLLTQVKKRTLSF